MKVYIKSSKYKRIARAEEFDNGHVIHNDWLKISDAEAEELAKQKSIEYPGSICYVQYDDIMNPSSDIQWVDGVDYHSYADALAARKNHIYAEADIEAKNPGMLEVPEGESVEDLSVKHFKALIDKKGRAPVIRALTNLEVWNKNDNKSLSNWAKKMKKSLEGYGEKE